MDSQDTRRLTTKGAGAGAVRARARRGQPGHEETEGAGARGRAHGVMIDLVCRTWKQVSVVLRHVNVMKLSWVAK